MGIKPYQGPYKVYLIEEAEKMTVQAQNALLKTLEEPPEYGVIILMTSSLEAPFQNITFHNFQYFRIGLSICQQRFDQLNRLSHIFG